MTTRLVSISSFGDVARLAKGKAEAFALAYCIVDNALMFAEVFAAQVDEVARG